MKTRKADWKAYFQLIHRANVPLLVLLGYFLVQLVYSRISTDLVPFASKIYTGEILDTAQIGQYVLLVAVMIAIWLVQNLFQYWFTYRTDRQFQLVTWQSMVHLPMAALDKQNAATLPSRVTSDSTKLSMGRERRRGDRGALHHFQSGRFMAGRRQSCRYGRSTA